MRALPLLLTLLLSACSSAPSSTRLSSGAPASALLVQPSSRGPVRLALVNPHVDPASAGFRRGEVSRLSEDLMIGVVAQLEAFRFFEAAVPGIPDDGGSESHYVAVFLPGGSWWLTRSRNPQAFLGAVKTITAAYNGGDTTFLAGSGSGVAPVDFRQQQEELRRLNRERMEKYR